MKRLCLELRNASKKTRKRKIFIILVYLGSKVQGGLEASDLLIMISVCGLIVFSEPVNPGLKCIKIAI